MARRRLLDDAFWAGVFALPSDEREVVRHCTLTFDDLALVATKRSPHGRLAYALLLLALRHPGRALDAGEVPPAPMVAYVARQVGAEPAAPMVAYVARQVGAEPAAPMVAYVARQVGAEPAALAVHHLRPQTRREQLAELMRRGGFRSFGRVEAQTMTGWLTSVDGSRRVPAELATALVEELRRRRILLPTPGVLERVLHEARARAERVVHRALAAGIPRGSPRSMTC